MLLTKAQRKSLKVIYERSHGYLPEGESYRTYRRKIFGGSFGCIMVPFVGMWIGIERDGHTHS
jgi:hypothetical protein